MQAERDPGLGSTGRWPVAFGRRAECALAPNATNSRESSRQAAANYRLAACAPRRLIARSSWPVITLALLLCPNFLILAQDHVLNLALPTDNDALFRGGGADFYQNIERDYKGVKSTPWEGGQYGFVRDPIATAHGLVYTRFHEGIDIRPLHRDARGEPLDEVRSIAAGKVVHTNLVPGYSNYGKYIVIEHRWDDCSYFSLYGHLSSVSVQTGDSVNRGDRIGVMGHTGTGLNQARAHVHLELNLMLSHQFEAWHDAFHKDDPNYNGIYNGINLTGLDIARLFLALRKDPSLTIPKFLNQEDVFFRVALPRSGHFELPRLYPWMVIKPATPETHSWEVSFAASGVPLKIEASDRPITQPELVHAQKTSVDCLYLTRGLIQGRGGNARFTDTGNRLMRLLIFPD
ncbi:MAG: murein DD-endopeptidase [Verrucomicrobiota bacterium]